MASLRDIGRLNVIAVIPVRGSDKELQNGMPVLAGKPLIAYTIEAARGAQLIDRVIVSTDSDEIRQISELHGAEAPFKRPVELTSDSSSLGMVLKHCVDWLAAEENYLVDIVVLLEITHPFREKGLIDKVIETLAQQGLDSVFTAYEEHHSFWMQGEYGELSKIGEEEEIPRQYKRPVYKEVSGLVCATKAAFIQKGKRLGDKVGLVPLKDIHALVDTHDEDGLWLAQLIMEAERKQYI